MIDPHQYAIEEHVGLRENRIKRILDEIIERVAWKITRSATEMFDTKNLYIFPYSSIILHRQLSIYFLIYLSRG